MLPRIYFLLPLIWSCNKAFRIAFKFLEMLQSFLIVAVPALVTLTAAFYLLHRVSRTEGPMHTPSNFQARTGFSLVGDFAANLRSRFRLPSRTAGPAGNNTTTGTCSEMAPYTGDCVVCFEERHIVQLYPCQHRSLCEECVIKIISCNDRICPLCRTHIQGYF